MGLILFLFWLGACFWIASVASDRGKSAFGYFLLSFFLSPMVGLIVVLVSRNDRLDREMQVLRRKEHELQLEQIKALSGINTTKDEFKRCEFCAEKILKDARKCKHCGSDLT